MKKFFMAIGLCASMLFSSVGYSHAETLSEHLAKTQVEDDKTNNITEAYAFNVNPDKCMLIDGDIDKVNCTQMSLIRSKLENGDVVSILSIGIGNKPVLLVMVPVKKEDDDSLIYQIAMVNVIDGPIKVSGGACNISTDNGKVFCNINFENGGKLMIANQESPVTKIK